MLYKKTTVNMRQTCVQIYMYKQKKLVCKFKVGWSGFSQNQKGFSFPPIFTKPRLPCQDWPEVNTVSVQEPGANRSAENYITLANPRTRRRSLLKIRVGKPITLFPQRLGCTSWQWVPLLLWLFDEPLNGLLLRIFKEDCHLSCWRRTMTVLMVNEMHALINNSN